MLFIEIFVQIAFIGTFQIRIQFRTKIV